MTLPAFSASVPLGASASFRSSLTPLSKPKTKLKHVQIPTASVRRPENVPGNLYVDNTCIDCSTCRWVAPHAFHSDGPQSAVYSQPESEADRFRAYQAMAACPTGSIRLEEPDNLAKDAAASFPTPALDAAGKVVPRVYYNGHTSKYSFGAASWVLATDEGNILFDCPRFSEQLAKRIERIGPLRYIVLSHSDDVYGHEVWAARFGVERIIHASECNTKQQTDMCEIKLTDADFPYKLLPGVTLIHVPGHTGGSIALLDEPSKSLFTGDHLGRTDDGELTAFKRYNCYSWDVQMKSVDMLKDVAFLHGFPGHGLPFHFKDAEERRRKISEYVQANVTVRA